MGMYDIDAGYKITGYPEIKVTKTGSDMYQLNIVPEDLTIYTWGSKNFNPTNLFNVSDLNEPYKVDKIGNDTNQGTPICLCLPTSPSETGYGVNDTHKTSATNNCIAYDSRALSNTANIRYVKEYYYKEYVLLIRVSVASSFSSTSVMLYDLDEYYEKHLSDYPIIRSVFIVPYYRNNTSNRKYIAMYPSIQTIASAKYTSYDTPKEYNWWNVTGLSTIYGVPVAFNNVTGNIPSFYQIQTNSFRPLDNLIKCRTTQLGYVSKRDYYVYFAPDLAELTKDQIMTECAKLGFCFATSTANAQSKKYGDSGFYVPEIKGGYTTGKYFDGTEANDLPQNSWTSPTASYDNSEYDPKKPIDPNNYTDKIKLNKPNLTTTGIFNRTFGVNAVNIKSLADFLWNADETIFNEIVKGLSLMGGNPIDGLIDLRLYPFDVVSKTSGGASKSIVVGRTDTKVDGIEINDYNAILDLGYCTFFPYFGNFLDYEPFTTASLYIPYVGIVPISTADFMGQTISCKMVVDITTGSCTAIVFANDIPIIYKNGNIGVEIPMTGTNSAEYASRIAGGLTSGATDVTLGAASKSVGQVVSGVGTIADSALSVNNTMYNTAGSSSPACGLWQPQNCYFIIQRPVPIVPENYGHTVGYACNYQATISECSGYTQTYNVDVSSINAPESEKNAIAEILNSGFYA